MSLVDNAAPAGESNPANATNTGQDGNQQPQNIDHSNSGTPQGDPWFYDENMPGQGNRPEWLNPKYKTAAEQAKAYNEAQKRLGAFKGAPDEYDLSLSEFPDAKFEKEDPFVQEFLEDARKNNVSQEYVTQMLNRYVKIQKAMMPDADKELEKLGPNAAKDIQILAQWASNHLSKEESTTFNNMITTADNFRVLEKLRVLASNPDTQPRNPNIPKESEADVRKLIHDPRYDTDEGFRNEVREKLKRFSA